MRAKFMPNVLNVYLAFTTDTPTVPVDPSLRMSGMREGGHPGGQKLDRYCT